ncbi:MAG: hypothetical protein ACE5IW_04870 [bacterium]
MVRGDALTPPDGVVLMDVVGKMLTQSLSLEFFQKLVRVCIQLVLSFYLQQINKILQPFVGW